MAKQYILTVLGGGQGYTLSDADLWGLECALQHGLQDGYFTDNAEWAKGMADRLIKLRADLAMGEVSLGPS